METINNIIAKNLLTLRKNNKMTQLEVAEKLNYSDKAISKWEQGESMPGIEVFCKLSELYGVSIDYIVGKENALPLPAAKGKKLKNRRIITLLSILAVWLVATVTYTAFDLFSGFNCWFAFLWAIPVSLIVAIVFDAIWHRKKGLFILISLLIWSLLMCFCLQFAGYRIWIILGVGVPLQIATVLWALLVK